MTCWLLFCIVVVILSAAKNLRLPNIATTGPAMRKHVISTPPLSQGEIRAASRIDRLEGSFVAEMAVSHLRKTR